MDAVKFIKERDRMYEVEKRAPSFIYRHEKSAEEIVREVEEWSAAHPRKTRQSVFLKQYPGAKIASDTGVPIVYPCQIEQGTENVRHCNSLSCADCRRDFWSQEVE